MGGRTEKYNAEGISLTREEQDEFAAPLPPARRRGLEERRLRRRDRAGRDPAAQGRPGRRRADEGVRGDTTAESLGKLRPAFNKEGTITAGSASQISDGAAAVVVMSKAKAEELGLEWLAEIGAHGMVAGPDSSLLMQPAARPRGPARRRASRPPTSTCSSSTRRSPRSASQSARDLGLTDDMVNVNGGAIALGHPVGMSGTRIVLHLALELQRRGGGVGAAALCGGGGQGDALIVRVPSS